MADNTLIYTSLAHLQPKVPMNVSLNVVMITEMFLLFADNFMNIINSLIESIN